MSEFKVKLLHENAKVPTYAHYGDAGADLYAIEDVLLGPLERQLVRTGVAIEIPFGFVGLIHPRSGLANKTGITVLNTPGTVDAGYRGEIRVNLINLGYDWEEIRAGDRIAQLLVQEVVMPWFVESTELSDTVRGENGHGSSGI